MTKVAKLFRNGRSQAVRLPAEFRFEGDEVFVRRDSETGDVILSKRPQTWQGYFEKYPPGTVPDDFLPPRDPRMSVPPKDPFEGEW